MADPAKFMIPDAKEKTTGTYYGTLRNESGAPLPASALNSFKLTLYDLLSSVIINSRSQQNVLNTNQVTVDANGNVVWTWLVGDVPVLVPNRAQEEHVALFEAQWTDASGNTRRLEHEVHMLVNRIPNRS